MSGWSVGQSRKRLKCARWLILTYFFIPISAHALPHLFFSHTFIHFFLNVHSQILKLTIKNKYCACLRGGQVHPTIDDEFYGRSPFFALEYHIPLRNENHHKFFVFRFQILLEIRGIMNVSRNVVGLGNMSKLKSTAYHDS